MSKCILKMVSRVPLIVILGATGSGKTKLSLDIAQKYGGEIISADSIQVYKGLDIITAKATKEEQALAPHHLLDMIEPPNEFSVVEFRNRALAIHIDKLFKSNKMPIVVGGTNYYIESILWKVLVEARDSISGTSHPELHHSETSANKKSCSDQSNQINKSDVIIDNRKTSLHILLETIKQNFYPKSNVDQSDSNNAPVSDLSGSGDLKRKFIDNHPETFASIDDDFSVPSVKLHDCLKIVDPETANRIHPDNRRKIIRALQVVVQQGRRLSDILREQQGMPGGSALGGPLRYSNTIIFWIKPEQKILDERLNKRVDKMIEDGLINELTNFHQKYNQERLQSKKEPDYTKGVFQTIGFKEFHDYLILDENERLTAKGQQLFEKGVEELKIVTRRYARKQERWIKNRVIGHPKRQVPPVYLLDSSDVSKWQENVQTPAIEIIDAFISESPCEKYKPLDFKQAKSEPASLATTYFCQICARTFIGQLQWNEHLNSRKHAKMVTRRKQMQFDEVADALMNEKK